ncbi:ribulose-phosphate 3-epimerase [Aminobacterium mobile]|jgi:ribulose-phosphate 3-epimerase|uniref:ribulose-phosphate 3-epimerase n=1 Tax=Aminobacterium mobile TaxID=81467 RepID=UPI00046473FD|nr:ribulose-phosphate 3-epimerase [Aminobacterium mobile]
MARSLPIGKKSHSFFVAPSLLSADVLNMEKSISSLQEQHDWLHLDIMDGHFVPNLSYGPSLAKAMRACYPQEVLDVHLMVEPPEDFIEAFASAKPDYLTVHVEATPHLHRVLSRIRSLGCRPGVALNPATPSEWVYPVLHMVDLVLIMSVNPGFGGQSFISETLEKTINIYRYREAQGLSFAIEMDGGIGRNSIRQVVASGCDVVVMGSSVFGTPDPAETIRELRACVKEAVVGEKGTTSNNS